MENRIFIKKAAVFLLILILLVYIINSVYLNLVLPKKNFYKKEIIYQNYLEGLPDKKIDFAFFGDSHAFHAANPNFIPNSFNFASGAENYIKTYYKLNSIINKDNVQVKTVILETDLQTFSTVFTKEPFLYNELELYSQFTPLEDIAKIRHISIVQAWIESHFSFLGRGKEYGILIKEPEFTELSLGWMKNTGNLTNLNETAVSISNYKTTYSGQERISNISMEYFIKTIKLAEENNATIIFIKYPYSKEYDRVLKENNITSDNYYNYIFTQVNLTNVNYTILDYHDIFFNNPEYFGDPEHTNYIGSKILSERIYEDLKNMGLTSNWNNNNINIPTVENNCFAWIIFTELLIIVLIICLLARRADKLS